jgi:hypothetical protein
VHKITYVFVFIVKIASVTNHGTVIDMRGADITQASIFSYRTLEERIPKPPPAQASTGRGRAPGFDE